MKPQTSVPSATNMIRLPRLEYSKDRFRNRENVLAEIEPRIQEMQQGKAVKQTVLLVWGVHGMGKSWVLQHVAHEYRYQPPVRRRKGVFAALASFEEFKPEEGALATLLSSLVDTITTSLPPNVLSDSAELTDFYKIAGTPEDGKGQQVADRFVDLVNALAKDYVPVLLFDALERLESEQVEFLNWFEENVVAPLVRWNRTIIILASRRELRQLRDFEVRRRVKKISLDAFPPKAVRQQVGSDAIGDLLYPVTYGHPLSTWYVKSRLDGVRNPGQEFTEEFLRDRQEDVVGLLQDIVEGLLFLDVTNPATKERLMIAATLRAFHIRSLQLILSAVQETPELKDQPDSEVQRWIGEMTDTNLVRWSMQRSGYEVEFTVRHIINRLCALQDDMEFIRRHREAFDLYRRWIEEMPFTSDRYIIEAAYHLGVIAQIRPDRLPEAQVELARILDKVLGLQRDIDLEHADTILQNVTTDEELRDTSGELYRMLQQRLSTLKERKLTHVEVQQDAFVMPAT